MHGSQAVISHSCTFLTTKDSFLALQSVSNDTSSTNKLSLHFSVMASRLLDQTGDILEVRMDECCEVLHTINEKKDVR